MLKRYLLFRYDQCLQDGGWNDFVGSFDTPEEANACTTRLGYEFQQIVDGQTGEYVMANMPVQEDKCR